MLESIKKGDKEFDKVLMKKVRSPQSSNQFLQSLQLKNTDLFIEDFAVKTKTEMVLEN